VLINILFELCQNYIRDKKNVLQIEHFTDMCVLQVSYICLCLIRIRHKTRHVWGVSRLH